MKKQSNNSSTREKEDEYAARVDDFCFIEWDSHCNNILIFET